MNKEDKEFATHFGKEIAKDITKQIKNKIDEINKEKDFIKRKEENDKYFFS